MQFNSSDILLAAISLGAIALMVAIVQFLFCQRYIRGEYARKLIHISTAIWIASWRFFMSQSLVIVLAIAMVVGFLVLRKFKLFRAIYAVRRATYGELSYAIAIGLTAFLFEAPEIYALAIVNLGFADGLAAIIGTRYGKKKYKLLGATKTFAGFSAAFLFAVLSGAVFWQIIGIGTHTPIFVAVHVLIAAGLVAGVELLGRKGTDNILIPLVTGIAFIGVL